MSARTTQTDSELAVAVTASHGGRVARAIVEAKLRKYRRPPGWAEGAVAIALVRGLLTAEADDVLIPETGR